MATSGRRASAGDRRRRAIAAVVVIALVLIAFGAGYVLARGGSDQTGATAAPSARPRATHTRAPRPTSSPPPSPTASATASAPVLPDGRSFVYARRVGGTAAAPTLTFDLAEFLTGQSAADAAQAHGDGSPPPNGYYIVNDNPRLRTMPVAPTVAVAYFPSGGPACCQRQAGTLDGFTAAVNGTATTDYPDMRSAPWWITVRDGTIVRIAQQYLP